MILNGDCLDHLRSLAENSIDSLVTDPPAGINFMGKEWDKSDGFIPFMTSVMQECLRVLKPGAHGLVWALPRTSHWTATALEDAGFEIRDVITHCFGSGFPKSLDISKAIDKAAGAEREVIGTHIQSKQTRKLGTSLEGSKDGSLAWQHDITSPSTDDAKKWSGFGTALKPASEHWILVRKPCSEDTVAKNVLVHGTGGINIDASRISVDPNDPNHRSIENKNTLGTTFGSKDEIKSVSTGKSQLGGQGRFPANLIFSHNPDCVEVGTRQVGNGAFKAPNARVRNNGIGLGTTDIKSGSSSAPDNYGTETVPAFECTEGCAVAELDRQSGVSKSQVRNGGKGGSGLYEGGFGDGAIGGFKDSGGASRFFYCAKASKKDKGENNTHPTVKSQALMSYLITLVTPPGGVCLDPFMGSGSTGVAAIQSGFTFIGIEKDPDYFEISTRRIDHALSKVGSARL